MPACLSLSTPFYQRGDGSRVSKMHQEPGQRGVILQALTMAPVAVLEKGIDDRLIELCYREPPTLKPGAQCREQSHRIPRCRDREAMVRQLLGDGIDMRAQRTGM
jgi:hypothetical protein